MLRQREFSRDKVLYRLLKNRSPTASSICEKLNHNVKNITLLSEDELCELWQHIKTILLEVQKLDELASNNKGKYVKEYSHMIKLIRTIAAIALETIVQRIFIPNVLLESIMLLHSVFLPNIKDDQAKNEISYLLENWWKLDMTWKEKVITNALKYLIQNCNSSLQNIKRLYEIRSTIVLLKCAEDVQELLKLVREKTVMSLEEGRMLILHLFTLGEQYILGIHNNVRVVLQNTESTCIVAYADLYVTAWLNATKKLKVFIVKNCLQNIVFHCFRAYRDSAGRGKLGQNLFLFLAAIHDSKYQTAKLMIHNQCKPLLWKHLEARGSLVRCNAVEILFMTSSVQYADVSKDRNKTYLQKFHQTVTDLLKDSDSEVCIVTMNGLFKMLEKYWTSFSNDIIRNWLNILLHYTKNASNYKIRANVFSGLRNILTKGRSHKILKDFLPHFANSIYDDNKTVLEELIKLLWHAQNELGMPFWNIVPLSYILDRLETTQDMFLLRELIKLVWLRVSSNGAQYDKIKDEIVYIGINNINAIRRFCLYSKPVIKWKTSSKLIQTMLPMIKEEMECLPLSQALKNSNKKAKHNNEERKQKNDRVGNCDEDIDSYRDVQIYVDVIAMLLIANIKNIEEEKFCNGEIKILQEIAHSMPEFFKYFKETSVNESVIFLFSLIPSRFFLNQIEVIETLVQQLCDPNTSDDTLLTIIYVLVKWNKGDTVLFALTNIFTESLNINTQYNQGVSNNTDTFQINEKGLELSLRILKHLLHVEHRSVLMNKYHKDILKFWENLHRLKIFIEMELNNECNINMISKDIIVQFFKEYISMISLLHKKDVFDASQHFSDILLWIKKAMVPHLSRIDMSNIENHKICIDLMKNTFDTSNVLLKECNSTPKLCCDIVLLYCSCLSPVSGIVFLNEAFDAIMVLLDFSQMAYEKQEPNLLNVVVPNFVCVTMVTLTRYDEDILLKYTNNLKILSEITEKYFLVIKNTFNDQTMYLPYITIMVNTAISSISTEKSRVLQQSRATKANILITKFPYLATNILKIILNKKRYQKLSVQVLTKTITSYTKIDMLSALIVIQKILKTSNKTVINRLKNVTLASKVHNQMQSYDTPFERSINDAINIVTDAILKQ
ncbi:Condensin-2 complex subunit G2 [Anthophora plagiata]